MSNRHKFDNSTSIAHIDYYDNDSKLEIGFSSGAVHHYNNCSKDHYYGMKNAESAGKYFHQHIRGKFENLRIDN